MQRFGHRVRLTRMVTVPYEIRVAQVGEGRE